MARHYGSTSINTPVFIQLPSLPLSSPSSYINTPSEEKTHWEDSKMLPKFYFSRTQILIILATTITKKNAGARTAVFRNSSEYFVRRFVVLFESYSPGFCFRKLIDYINAAKVSLDVCVFTISSHELGCAILKKYKEGVRVRVITDLSMWMGSGSQIPLFKQAG